MKVYITLITFLLLGGSAFTQATSALFSVTDETVVESIELELIDTYTLLDLNTAAWNQILETHPESFSLTIPYGDIDLKVNLEETILYKDGFTLRTASGEMINMSEVSKSVYYHGRFEGYPESHFAFSVLNHEIIGIGSIPGIGDVNFGKLPDYEQYIFYSESAVDGHNNFECDTRGEVSEPKLYDATESRAVVEDCSGFYFEVDYDIFLAKGSVIEAADYMTALFNEVQFLFELDDMTTFISDMKVWDEESPYFGIVDTGTLLDLFGTTTVVWDGDLGHLVTDAASGGLAWLDVYCSPDQAIRKAVSGIDLTFAAVPMYSWSVEVIAHEMGHNMGSPHTHACFWNDDMTAIDGCGPTAGFDEGCAGDLPDDGGTVMSYCHLTDAGINLGNGFGEQPGTHLRNTILDSDCLESCDLQVMDVTVTGGAITASCENSPIKREIYVANINSNENLTYCYINVYFDGVLTETLYWSGLIAEGASGVIYLPDFSLPLGEYNMTLEVILPDGYEDETPGDNSFGVVFEVTPFPIGNFTINPDELVSYDATTNMYNNTTGAVAYRWDFGDGSTFSTETNPEHTFPFQYGGYYEVILYSTSSFGCIDTTSAFVDVEGVNIFYIPNTFTPDGDAFNDEFTPIFGANLDVYDYHFVVQNRWGEVVFESYNVAEGWNGRYGGNGPATEGVYVWILEFGDLTSDEKHTHTGTVTLMR